MTSNKNVEAKRLENEEQKEVDEYLYTEDSSFVALKFIDRQTNSIRSEMPPIKHANRSICWPEEKSSRA